MKQPDPKRHQQISFIKSVLRIAGYAFLVVDLRVATIVLVISEVFGLIEEMV